MRRSVGTPTTESAAFVRAQWGDPMLANLAGTTARADGPDPASAAVRGMTTEPESLDVRPFGAGAGILAPLQLALPWLPSADDSKAQVDAVTPPGGAAGLLGLPPNLGSRVGFGALGLGLALLGAYALLRS